MTPIAPISQQDNIIQQQIAHHQLELQNQYAQNVAQANIAQQNLVAQQQQQIFEQEAILQEQAVQQTEESDAAEAEQAASAEAAASASAASTPLIDPSETPLVSGAVSSVFTQLIANAAATPSNTSNLAGAALIDGDQRGHEADPVIRAYGML